MFSRHDRIIGVIYLLADALLALASFWLAHQVRLRLGAYGLRPLYPAHDYLWIVPVSVGVWVAVGMLLGIYREIREEKLGRAFADPLRVAVSGTILVFAFIFAFQLAYISRVLLGVFVLIDLAAMIAFRLLARRFSGPLRRSVSGIRQFLLIGNTPEACEIARKIEAYEAHGQRLSGFALVERTDPAPDQSGLRRSYPVYPLIQLRQLLRQHVIDEVIVAVSKDQLELLQEAFLVCEEEGVRTRLLLSFFPHLISKVSFERLGDRPLLTFSATPENESLLFLKRVGDLLMSFCLLVLLAPVFLVLILLIKLTSRGPVLYRQTRCGLGGRHFVVHKFRSMRPDADLLRDELIALNEMDGPVFKIRNDPRCTTVGRFMRKYSLDELPQLFDIFTGDMSFVGPRPPLPEEVEHYEPWQRRRLRMRPGLTCLWALEGRNRLNFRRWMELDLQYIDNWSPTLDWKILLKTIPVVLLGRGAS